MRSARLLRSTTFHWAVGAALALLVQTVVVSGFFWLATTRHAGEAINRELSGDCAELRRRDRAGVLDAVTDRNNGDLHRTGYAALFDGSGTPLLGNLDVLPDGLVADGRPQTRWLRRSGLPSANRDEARVVACSTLSGDELVLGRDLDELAYINALVTRALAAAVVPAILISLLIGLLLSMRAQRRIGQVQASTERIIAGELRERLPVGSTGDAFDRLSASVNRMLDRIQALMEELRGIGDDIAHELRTPLTRLRARLERGCEEASTPEQFRTVGERAISDVDQTLGIIAAQLRIHEIEQGKRRIEFTRVELRKLLEIAVELYEPMAETLGIRIDIEAPAPADVFGDADLLMEAVANLLDNAVKFARSGERVQVRLGTLKTTAFIEVRDRGPGIGAAERRAVLRRFHRGQEGRRVPGIGIGLSLVDAILTLHGFRLVLEDGQPGCVATIICNDRVDGTDRFAADRPAAAAPLAVGAT